MISASVMKGLTTKGTEVIRKNKSNSIKNAIKSSIPKDKVDKKEIRVLIVDFENIFVKWGFFLSSGYNSHVVSSSFLSKLSLCHYFIWHLIFPGNPDIPISSILPVTSINPFIETVQIVTPPPPGGDCTDTDTNCAYWESIGQCQKNPKFMKQNCPKICKMCIKGPPVNGGWTQWSKSSLCSVCIIKTYLKLSYLK